MDNIKDIPPPPQKYEIRQVYVNGRHIVRVNIPGLMNFETNRQHDEMNQSGPWTPHEDDRMLKIIQFGISKEAYSIMTGRPQSAIVRRLKQLSILYSLDEWDYSSNTYNLIRKDIQDRLQTDVAATSRWIKNVGLDPHTMKTQRYELFNKEEFYGTDKSKDNDNED